MNSGKRAAPDAADGTEFGRPIFMSIRRVALNARPTSEPYPISTHVTIVKFEIVFSKSYAPITARASYFQQG
jgi:hypothetical protein